MNPTDNWQPGPFPTMPEAPTVCSGKVCFGAGVPDNADGLNGSIYINTSTGDIYTKTGDVWTLTTAGGGGGGSVQVYEYTTTDPTTDGVVPADQDAAALAYKRTGDGPIFQWSTVAHTWA